MAMFANNPSHEKRPGEDMGKSIWTSLLSEVSSRSTKSRLSGNEKNIIILGNDLSGKSMLSAKLQGKEDPDKGSGLEYQFMEIQDDDVDEKAVCGIWILEGTRSYRGLLNIALPKNRICDSILIITVDMSQPWDIMESLDTWTAVIREHMDQLKLSAEEINVLEKNVIHDFQKYVDPSEASEGKGMSSTHISLSKEGSDEATMPLGENTLVCNLGIPLVVVCTKCDYTEKLEKDHDYKDEHFDFIQHRLRTFCLKNGAALFHTSVKENKNMEILYKYLLHRLYDFPFDVPASVVDKDSLFVPFGWDTEEKINVVSENFTKISLNDAYESVIVRPIMRKPWQEMKEIVAEDEQSFLSKAQALLSSPVGSSLPRSSVPNLTAMDTSRLKGSQPSRATIGGVAGASASKLKPNPNKPAKSNEVVLANFFNSLLNKKPASSGSLAKADKADADTTRLQQQANMKPKKSPPPGGKQ